MEARELERMNGLIQRVASLERELEQKLIAGDRFGGTRLVQKQRGLDLATAQRAVEGLAASLGV